MKKLIIILAALFIGNYCSTVNAQTIENNKIILGTVDSIQSDALKELRKVWVYVPTSAANSDAKYPVVYVLDGDGHFTSVVGMIKQLSTNGNIIVPEMIVVAIPNTDRNRDLTPSLSNNIYAGNSPLTTSGGGDNFMNFIENELIPYVDSKYPTTNYRTYIGHSFGGLASIYTLLQRPHLFNNYISIDPSLWWDNELVLKQAKSILNEKDFSNKSLYVGIANTMPKEFEIENVEKDTTLMTNHIRSILEFSKTVVPNSSSGLNFNYKYYENDSHSSAPFITEYDAFRFLFSWYDLGDIMNDITNPETSTEAIINNLNSHYKTVSEHFAYKVNPPENLINQLGYGFIGQENFDKALVLFKMNVENYPESSNVYDSLGDAYVALEENDKAIEAFSKALTTGGGNTYSKAKLDALKEL